MEIEIKDLLFRNNCFLFGSHVYKKTLRGEENNDLDFGCENIRSCIGQLSYIFGCGLIAIGPMIIEMKCDKLMVDIIDKKVAMEMITKTDCDPFRIVMIGNNKFGYIQNVTNETPIISQDKKTINKIINNTKNNIMNDATLFRDKDKKYFEDWIKIKED